MRLTSMKNSVVHTVKLPISGFPWWIKFKRAVKMSSIKKKKWDYALSLNPACLAEVLGDVCWTEVNWNHNDEQYR